MKLKDVKVGDTVVLTQMYADGDNEAFIDEELEVGERYVVSHVYSHSFPFPVNLKDTGWSVTPEMIEPYVAPDKAAPQKLQDVSQKLQDMRIRVSSPEESKLVQEYLFEQGYKWGGAGATDSSTSCKWLYAHSEGHITVGIWEETFNNCKYPEYRVETFIKLVPVPIETVDVNGVAVPKKKLEEFLKQFENKA